MRNGAAVAWATMLLLGCGVKAEPTDALKLVGSIPLEGVEGRIDHMAADAAGRRLFVAALGNDTVEVIDLAAGKQLGRINGLKKPQGVAFLPDSKLLVVASGGDGKVMVYDASQKLIGAVSGLDDADNVRYDPDAKLVYVGYGDGALAVIDPVKVQKVADIKLDGHPESFQLEAKGNRIFVNVPDARQVAVVDRQKRSVIARWPMKEATANFPMALDEDRHRLLIGCRGPAKLLALDAETGRVVSSLDCCGDTDDLFHDAGRQRIYLSGGQGCITVFEPSDPDTYRKLGIIPTAAGARTSFFVRDSGRLYVAVPHRGDQRSELRVFEAK